MRPDDHIRKLGRRGQRRAAVNNAAVLRRLRRFHELRQRGVSVAEAARRLGIHPVEANRLEDFLTDLIHALKTEAVPADGPAETAPTAHETP